RGRRPVIAGRSAVDAAALPRLGARGLVRPAANALQVVVGPEADQFAGEIRGALPAARAPAHAGSGADAAALLAALGGRANVHAVETASSRLRVSVGDAGLVQPSATRGLGMRGGGVPVPGE